MQTQPETPKPKGSLFSRLKNIIKDRNLPTEIKPGAKRVHQVTEGSKLRDKNIVAAANDLSSLINNMVDRGQYPVLEKWLNGTASREEIRDAQRIIGSLRIRIAAKY